MAEDNNEKNKPTEIYGCMACGKEYKDDAEAQMHFDEFKKKGDKTHVTTLVRLVGKFTEIKKKTDYTVIEQGEKKED